MKGGFGRGTDREGVLIGFSTLISYTWRGRSGGEYYRFACLLPEVFLLAACFVRTVFFVFVAVLDLVALLFASGGLVFACLSASARSASALRCSATRAATSRFG